MISFGRFLASSTNSFSVLYGCWSLTTSTHRIGDEARDRDEVGAGELRLPAEQLVDLGEARDRVDVRRAACSRRAWRWRRTARRPAPAAPALVSITTGCLMIGSSTAASGRPTTSTAPPGGNGLMRVIGAGRIGVLRDVRGPVASAAAAAAEPTDEACVCPRWFLPGLSGFAGRRQSYARCRRMRQRTRPDGVEPRGQPARRSSRPMRASAPAASA